MDMEVREHRRSSKLDGGFMTRIAQAKPYTGTLEDYLDRWGRPLLAVYWVMLAMVTHWPQQVGPSARLANSPALGSDKLKHLACWAILTLLLVYARVLGRKRHHILNVLAGAGIAAVYGYVDEITQMGERELCVIDVYANWVGVGLALIACLLVKLKWFAPATLTAIDAPLVQSDRPTTFVGHALLISALTFGSRILGLVRDAILAAYLGMSAVTDAFWIGFIIPNLFRRLFGEGALTATFIPVYTDLVKTDRQLAARVASLCLVSLAILLCAITIIGELILLGVGQARSWTPDGQVAIWLIMIMLPYMPLVCLVAMFGAILQVHRRFGPAAAAPMILNLCLILFTICLATGIAGEGGMRNIITWVASSVIVAGLFQFIWLFLAVIRHERFVFHFEGAGVHLRSIMTAMVPMVIALAVIQINTLADSLIALLLSPKEGGAETLRLLGWKGPYPIQSGSVTALQFAQRLYQFPLGVFGIAIATAIFPAFARASDNRSEFREILRHGLRLTVFVGLPASAGVIIVRLPLVSAILERNQFGGGDSVRVATILAGYAVAIWAYSMIHVLTRAFYAMKDARTPLKISCAMVVANVVLNLTLIWPFGTPGLAWSTAFCAIGQCVFLGKALGRHVDNPIDRTVFNGWLRTGLMTAVMAVVVVAVGQVLADVSDWITLLVQVVVGVVTFGLLAWGSGANEIQWLRRDRGDQSSG